MKLFFLFIVMLLFLAVMGCASAEKRDLSQRYAENVETVQVCMFNVIYGVLAIPAIGFQGFHDLCAERPGALK